MLEPVRKVEAEREELSWLLTSGVLGRANNAVRVLTCVCEKYFENQLDQINEHTIAIEALGRRSDFDPQVDTIVRVTIHSLRKRLLEVYQNEGASRPVHILIPAGNYAPSFIHKEADSGAGQSNHALLPIEFDHGPAPAIIAVRGDALPFPFLGRRRWQILIILAAVAAVLLGAVFSVRHSKERAAGVPASLVPSPSAPLPGESFHALIGSGRDPYVDSSSIKWTSGEYCTGGTPFTVPDRKIEATEDPYIYLGGLQGGFHCQFPVKPGLYEVHLLFAETAGLPDATRNVSFSVNGSDAINLDVVDDATGAGVATTRILTRVEPESDGAIHLDFFGHDSILNGVEILPAPSAELLPVRIVAGPRSYKDSAERIWLSDRYFIGGRTGMPGNTANPGIYGSDRIGHFHYIIPVLPLRLYRVNLYFLEPWFGEHNNGRGGVGSRIFDVSCNGSMLLKNFDILRENGGGPVMKTFDSVQATAQGKIELYFTPVANYPLVNAIEVVPQPSR
jgi:hypothetical protein